MNTRLPVLFLSHGSPMHAIEPSAAADAWAQAAAGLLRPRAVLMVSAHWDSGLPLLGGSAQPETIYDFGGFPDELYRIRYAAPGAPDVAQQAQALLREAGFTAGIDGCRGLDHGAWIPMLKMYPQADVPVLQLSVQPALGAAHHHALGQALASLRDAGVLIVGSGHMTHNLRDAFVGMRQGDNLPVAAYANEFRDWIDVRVRGGQIDELLQWETQAPQARRAHPTPEHFLPLFVALGAAGAGYQVQSLSAGYDFGVLAMDAYRFT
ncbi:DODA-type extradiol aromatic ring-opening family dioxygenase [Uliginosibacterium flavum]|uniref:Class III extradiol ring-cleavage dioxygenase n=1 Tax=Uliginosibacterium flavum TaxID=1396831 RepID=A0ABV2TPM1_9RHOO